MLRVHDVMPQETRVERVVDRMSPNPIRVQFDTPIAECARRMFLHRLRQLPVCDGAGRLVGLLHDSDVQASGAFVDLELRQWVAFDEGDGDLTAGALAAVAVTVREDERIDRALLAVMGRGAVPIVDDAGRLTGIFTEHDGVVVALERVDPKLTTVHEGHGPPVQTLPADAPAVEALRRMKAGGFRHLVVVDRVGGAAEGVVTRADLWAEGVHLEPRGLIVADVMGARPIVSVPCATGLRVVAAMMIDSGVGCVPVLDRNRRPVHIVTRTDLIGAALAAVEEDGLFSSPSTEG